MYLSTITEVLSFSLFMSLKKYLTLDQSKLYVVDIKRSDIYFFRNVYGYSFLIRTDNYLRTNGYLVINSTHKNNFGIKLSIL